MRYSLTSCDDFFSVVRELIRSRISIRDKQRGAVKALVEAYAEDRWTAQSPMGQYAASALRVHTQEALLTNPLHDPDAEIWLDQDDDLINNIVVRSASDAIGPANLMKMGERLLAEGHIWESAKRTYSAIIIRMGLQEFTSLADIAKVSLPVADLIMAAEPQSLATRNLEFMM